MDHVAYLTKKYRYIDKIVKKEKTIESRWYVNQINPWNNIKKEDAIYFKESGMPITAMAKVKKVLQFTISKKRHPLLPAENSIYTTTYNVYKKYGKQIFPEITKEQYKTFSDNKKNKNYCILIFLKNTKMIHPFNIDKTGYGNACAWICVDKIKKLNVMN